MLVSSPMLHLPSRLKGMKECCIFLGPSSSTAASNIYSSSPNLQGSSVEGTPRSSAQPSPTVNLTSEYALAVHTLSYTEIWSKIHPNDSSFQDMDPEQQLSAQVLQPNRESVQEALRWARPSTLTRLVSEYFDHSENTSKLCLLLYRSVHHARSLYASLRDLLDVLPFDTDYLTQSQCNSAFDIFLEFDCLENPFPSPDSPSFHDMRCCFSQLKQQLNFRISKSRSKIRVLRRVTTGSSICLIGTAIGVVISAIAIASHAFVALVACPFLPALLPSKITKKEMAHLAQLDAAAMGTYVLHHHLDTIDRLVASLHIAFEGDKLLIRLGLERGREKHPIQEVVKQLRKNHLNLFHQLTDLEEHLCLCFAAINRARSLLLQEIRLHQPNFS